MPIMAWSCEGMVKNFEKNVKIIGTFINSDYGVSRPITYIMRRNLPKILKSCEIYFRLIKSTYSGNAN